MKTKNEIQWTSPGNWRAVLASLLPLWLLSIAITVEGFPKPPIPLEFGVTTFVLTFVTIIILPRKGWLDADILLCSFLPLILLFNFDEISTRYKTPFIMMCALILSMGFVGAQRSGSAIVRWLILLFVAVTVLALSSNAIHNYWQMVGGLDFPFECMPDTRDCPLPDNLSPWWALFFS